VILGAAVLAWFTIGASDPAAAGDRVTSADGRRAA